MSIELRTLWRCPACHLPLIRLQKKWLCDNNHSFDVAKESYVNLLLAQHRNSKVPGDNKEMVLARRAFLSENHYLPLANHIAQLLKNELLVEQSAKASDHLISIFDAGCGEGYYLNAIADYLLDGMSLDNNRIFHFAGIDIAKPAIQKAAKRKLNNAQTKLEFAVASTFNIPLTNHSQDAVIQIFAPSKTEEIHRILKPKGVWLTVNPSSDHLFELKEMVYDKAEKHSPQSKEEVGFEILSADKIKFTMTLNTVDQRENLLMMTPFYWTISADKKALLLEKLQKCSAHFDVKLLRSS